MVVSTRNKGTISERGLLQLMKSMEELTIEAAVTGNYATALQAFTSNPLVQSGDSAKALLDELLEAHKQYYRSFTGKKIVF
ncbi:hypothetical protein BSK58_04690 [Paenibacillus odorifer]|nr:hypothetical protein BSK58_04690 [Paenibacillus odorifer]